MDDRIQRSLPAWSMLVVGLLLTAVASFEVRQGIEADAVKRFALVCDQLTLKIQERLGAYALILRGGAALFAASPAGVERGQWRDYVATLRASGNVPGVQGIGFQAVIAPDQLAAHIASVRREGFPDYRVWPPGQRPVYTPVIFLEPFRERNLRALGFDGFSEPVRRAAMERARDSGDAALSGKVELVQEIGSERQAGTLMFVPVYRNGAPVSTIGQRRLALLGWTYGACRMQDLMGGIFANGSSRAAKVFDLKIYDGHQPAPARLLFASRPEDTSVENSLLDQSRTIDFGGTRWLLEFDGSQAAAAISYAAAWMTLAAGVAISGLLFGLMLSVINTRANARRIAASLTDEIRSREALLKESEFRWKFAIEGSGFGLWDWNVSDGQTFFSKQLKAILGYSENEVLNSYADWESHLHPDDKAGALAAVSDHLDGRSAVYVGEHRLRCQDGSYRWVLSHGLVVSRSDDGRPLRMIGTTMDISERKSAEDALREQKEFFHLIAENIGDFIAVLDLDGRRLYSSPSYRQFFHAVDHLPGTDSFANVHPEDQERVRRAFREAVQTGRGRRIEYRFLRDDGSVHEMESVGNVIRDHDGRVVRVVVVSHDVTERRQAEKALRESEAFKDIVLNSVPAEIAVVDHQGLILAVNEQWRRFALENGAGSSGALANTDVGADYLSSCRVAGEQAAEGARDACDGIRAVLDGKLDTFSLDYPCHSPDQQRWFTMTVTPCACGQASPVGAVITHIDITGRRQMEDQVRQLAFHDPLTELPNRRLFYDRLIQSLAASARSALHGAVMFLDLDNFKPLNDLHGHEAGDLLLIEVASRLKACVREMDTAARIGGDEFVVMIIDLAADKSEAATKAAIIADKIRVSLAEPYLLSVHREGQADRKLEHRCTASIGVALFIDHQATHEEILKAADAAMYQAKEAGRNSIRFADSASPIRVGDSGR